jgi:hypothetical protein
MLKSGTWLSISSNCATAWYIRAKCGRYSKSAITRPANPCTSLNEAATPLPASGRRRVELNPAKYIGVFAAEKMAELQHRIAKSGNEGGYASLFMDLARLVVEEYPDIAPEEKAAVLSSMKGQTALLKMRTGIDASAGLGEAERILESGLT